MGERGCVFSRNKCRFGPINTGRFLVKGALAPRDPMRSAGFFSKAKFIPSGSCIQKPVSAIHSSQLSCFVLPPLKYTVFLLHRPSRAPARVSRANGVSAKVVLSAPPPLQYSPSAKFTFVSWRRFSPIDRASGNLSIGVCIETRAILGKVVPRKVVLGKVVLRKVVARKSSVVSGSRHNPRRFRFTQHVNLTTKQGQLILQRG